MPALFIEEEGTGKGKGKKQAEHKLGTFKGVFMPTCENMWGVIIFLRFYTIAGHAGLGYSLIIITLSFFVALLTGLSLSAIATCAALPSLAGPSPPPPPPPPPPLPPSRSPLQPSISSPSTASPLPPRLCLAVSGAAPRMA